MKRILLFITCIAAFSITAQDDKVLDPTEQKDVIEKLTEEVKEEKKDWTFSGLTTLNFSQVALSNWAGGGVNSISATGLINLNANYAKNKDSWTNSLDLAYGLLKNKDADAFKSDDRIELNSKYGRKATEHWYYSALLNFKTQFAPGYSTPGETVTISDFFAPAYLITALGMDYQSSENFSLFLSPATSKITIVNAPTLSAVGAFGVDPGETIRTEFGAYVKMNYKRDIVENVNFQTKLDLFSNYLNNPQNIDVSWETLIGMKINKFMSASISTHLIYDDDIDIAVDDNNDGVLDGFGPRIQFKEVLAIGLSYKF